MTSTPRILITAFDPYDIWPENSSWLTLVEFTKQMPSLVQIKTRRYPVDFQAVQEKLERDLREEYDFALHLGQAPGSAAIRLEAIGLNIGGTSQQMPEAFQPLIADGPAAYRCRLPLGKWAETIRAAGIPAGVSYHAGTYLCNALLYLSHYFAEKRKLRTQSTFIHLPLDPSQTVKSSKELAALPITMCAQALRMIVEDLAGEVRPRPLAAEELA